MKKIIFLAIATMFIVNTASAQFTFGVKAGANVASISNAELMVDGDVSASSRIGFVAGAFAEYGITDAFALSADLLYSQQGSVVKQKGEGNAKATLKADYLNLPILANYYIIEGLAVKAGIQPGFLLSAKVDGDDWKDNAESFDISIPVGVSYTIPMGLVFEARYNLGLTKANKVEASKDLKHGVLSVTVGYKF